MNVSKQYQLKKYAEATLGAGYLKEIVKLPKGEDLNEWLAMGAVDFFSQTNMLFSLVFDWCTPLHCPIMSAGPKYSYYWKDDSKKGNSEPIQVPAPKYVDLLMTWIQAQIDNERLFPTKLGIPFSANFPSVVKVIFKRLHRVYAHLYHSHFDHLLSIGEEVHLNTSY
ncbi:Mob1/phocein, partial [Conidiobolus coronatus NRRL 28638]